MVTFTPNDSLSFGNAMLKQWHRLWGNVHPQLIDDKYVSYNLNSRPTLLASTPVDTELLCNWDRVTNAVLDLSGNELLIVTIKEGPTK